MKFLALTASLAASLALTACVNSSITLANRSITYEYTPSVEGNNSTITEQPKTQDATVNAERTSELKSNFSATGDVNDSSQNEQGKDRTDAEKTTEKSSNEDI